MKYGTISMLFGVFGFISWFLPIYFFEMYFIKPILMMILGFIGVYYGRKAVKQLEAHATLYVVLNGFIAVIAILALGSLILYMSVV